MAIDKQLLVELYHQHRLSMAEIAERLGCSHNKVVYWMEKYSIERRSMSEAMYHWQNPDGDPFEIQPLETEESRELFSLAIGLYIGEGKKRDECEVAVANTDPQVIRVFLRFLREICRVDESKLRAWINIFNDVDLARAKLYWEDVTRLPRTQFYKAIVRTSRGGTYTNKSEYGTLTVSIANTKLHDLVLCWCSESLSK